MKKRIYKIVIGQPKYGNHWVSTSPDLSLIGERISSRDFSKKQAIELCNSEDQNNRFWNFEVKEIK